MPPVIFRLQLVLLLEYCEQSWAANLGDASHRRGSSMSPKSTEQELRDEIERFNIEFVGLLLPSEWPEQYADMFKKVRIIGKTSWEPDEVNGPVADNDTLDRRRMKIRALQLMHEAQADRKDRVNEPTLRGNAEPLVFGRFKMELKWCSIDIVNFCCL